MVQQQEMITERLVHVISSIQRGRRSGVLTAKRGEGIFLEEGTIAFANGQVSQASAGRRRGSEALNWLSTWENCRCMFVASKARVHAPQPSLPAKSNAMSPMSPVSPVSPISPPAPQSPIPSSSERQERPQVASERESSGEKEQTDTPASAAPYPIQQLDAALRLIEQDKLSRMHKQLFYLVDGRRSIVDLVRLTGKRGSEMYKLLGELERAGVIRVK